MPQNDKLINNNPWTGTKFHRPQSADGVYLPLIREQFQEDRWYYASTDKDNIESTIGQNCDKNPDMKKFFFNLDPQPWIGRWNVEREEDLPEVVILSLNPGIGDRNFFDEECESIDKAMDNGRKYYNLMTKLFNGEASTSEVVLNPIWQHYNGSYWLEKLFPLIEEIENRKIEKTDLLYLKEYSDRLKSMFDRIMFVDLCPYHSLNANALGTLMKGNVPKFKSMNFTKRLVEMFMDKGKKIIITRASTKWKEFIPRLKDYGNIYTLNSKQNASVSEHNCNNFEEIVDSLKKSLI